MHDRKLEDMTDDRQILAHADEYQRPMPHDEAFQFVGYEPITIEPCNHRRPHDNGLTTTCFKCGHVESGWLVRRVQALDDEVAALRNLVTPLENR